MRFAALTASYRDPAMTLAAHGLDRVVLASGNAGKLREFRELFAPLGIELVPQAELGIDDADETGLTFVENALIKARHASRLSGLPALADDSGLCVDALGGAPGLYSARYAGPGADGVANIAKLLDALHGMPDHRRGTHFVCVLALLRHADDPDPLIASGRWHGRIAEAPRGERGFGYDPVFVGHGSALAAAEMTAADKHAVSHRGIALERLANTLADQPSR
jgi:XTP/dITP diphosphohydrolase